MSAAWRCDSCGYYGSEGEPRLVVEYDQEMTGRWNGAVIGGDFCSRDCVVEMLDKAVDVPRASRVSA